MPIVMSDLSFKTHSTHRNRFKKLEQLGVKGVDIPFYCRLAVPPRPVPGQLSDSARVHSSVVSRVPDRSRTSVWRTGTPRRGTSCSYA